MYTCVICRSEVELDDVIIPIEIGCCICLRCFNREEQTDLPMPRDRRRQTVATLAETRGLYSIVRRTSDGAIDTTFGANRYVSGDTSSNEEMLTAIGGARALGYEPAAAPSTRYATTTCSSAGTATGTGQPMTACG